MLFTYDLIFNYEYRQETINFVFFSLVFGK